MKCKICNSDQTIRSMAMHLKHNHQIKTNEYVALYGEFRPKQLLVLSRLKKFKIECKICNKEMMNTRQLMYHLTKSHKNISQKEYIIKYELNGNRPLCKCGCGEETTFLRHGNDGNNNDVWFREYIKGHWDWVQPNWISHSYDTKIKMRKIKIDQIKENPNYQEKISKSENELFEFISKYIFSIQSDRTILNGKELDIIIPEKNIAIEFNGMHYHSDKYKDKNYHLNKTKECELNNYRLIHIWESDWKFKRKIIESNILNILNFTPNKIYARKCILKEVPRNEASIFLNNNHLQGYALDKFRIGLYYENELVSLMTFSKGRKNLGNNSREHCYELLRFCNKLNTTVIGGASKLFNFFIKKYFPQQIISYANRDWSIGNLYKKLNFKFIGYTSPGYFYSKSNIKYNRFLFRKDILIKQGFDPNKTEFEIMNERGYHKIWNTGNLKFTWEI